MNLLTKCKPDPTVDKAATTIQKQFVLKKMLKTLLQCETNFSLLKQLLKDLNGQIEVPQVMNLVTKFHPDPMMDRASVVAGSC